MTTVAFTHAVAELFNDFVAEGFHLPALAAAEPQNALVADFLHLSTLTDIFPNLTRTQLQLVHAVVADFLHTTY